MFLENFKCISCFQDADFVSSTYVALGTKRGIRLGKHWRNTDFDCFPNISSFAYPSNISWKRRICVPDTKMFCFFPVCSSTQHSEQHWLKMFLRLPRRAWIIRNQWPTFPIGDPHSWVHFCFLALFRKRTDRFVVSFWIILQQQQLLLLLLIWLSAALSYYLILMFSKLWCRNIDLQKLIKLLTVVMSTVRMDTVGLSGKHVIQSIL